MLALTVKHEAQPVQVKAPIQIEQLRPKEQKLPNFDIEILTPLRATQAAEQAELDKLAAEEAERARQAQIASQVVYTPATYVQSYGSGTLIAGTLGYARSGGNCVAEPGINNPGWGNPSSWPILYAEPAIGRTAIFTYNHVSYIVGLWSNGDIEVRHQNWQGAPQTRFPRSSFRGYR